MNIDWDKIGQEADKSPRAVLAEFLAMADELETVVVIVNRLDKEGHDEWCFSSSGSSLKVAALLSAADRFMQNHVDGEDD